MVNIDFNNEYGRKTLLLEGVLGFTKSPKTTLSYQSRCWIVYSYFNQSGISSQFAFLKAQLLWESIPIYIVRYYTPVPRWARIKIYNNDFLKGLTHFYMIINCLCDCAIADIDMNQGILKYMQMIDPRNLIPVCFWCLIDYHNCIWV